MFEFDSTVPSNINATYESNEVRGSYITHNILRYVSIL